MKPVSSSNSHVNISVVMSMANGQKKLMSYQAQTPVTSMPKSTTSLGVSGSSIVKIPMQDKFINDDILSNHNLLF